MDTGRLERLAFVRFLTHALEWIGACVLIAMMLLTFVDVVGRYLFSAPVPGGFEITELLLASIIYCGLPLITLRDGHITVDLMEGFFPVWFKALRDRVVFAGMALVLGFISARLFNKAGDFVEYNDQTAVLNIPLAPLCYGMAVLGGISALIACVLVVTGRQVASAPELNGQADA